MEAYEMVATVVNCRSGNLTLACASVALGAQVPGRMTEGPENARQAIRARLLELTVALPERQVGVRAEWRELRKTRRQGRLDFEAKSEKRHRSMVKGNAGEGDDDDGDGDE